MEASKSGSMNFSDVISKSQDRIESIKKERDTKTTSTMRNVIFGSATLASLLIAGMLVLQILTGVFALTVTGLFGLGAFFVLKNFKKYDKLVAQKIKNHVLGEQLKEAQKNNIIQLKNTVLDRKDRLQEGIQAHNKMGGYVSKIKLKVDNADPSNPFNAQTEAMYERVSKAYDLNKERLLKAKKAIDEFEQKVYHYEGMAEIAEMASKAMATIANNELEDMLSLEAFNSIDNDFCEAMVGLENAVEFED